MVTLVKDIFNVRVKVQKERSSSVSEEEIDCLVAVKLQEYGLRKESVVWFFREARKNGLRYATVNAKWQTWGRFGFLSTHYYGVEGNSLQELRKYFLCFCKEIEGEVREKARAYRKLERKQNKERHERKKALLRQIREQGGDLRKTEVSNMSISDLQDVLADLKQKNEKNQQALSLLKNIKNLPQNGRVRIAKSGPEHDLYTYIDIIYNLQKEEVEVEVFYSCPSSSFLSRGTCNCVSHDPTYKERREVNEWDLVLLKEYVNRLESNIC